MIKHTIAVSGFPARLKLRNDQLVLILEDNQEKTYACEDVGVLLLQHPAISLSAAVVSALMDAGAIVIFCDKQHMPTGLLLPVARHTEVVARLREQIEATLPQRKRLWQQIIQAKILAQAAGVPEPTNKTLKAFAQKVRSGDPDNLEARASRVYWAARFPTQYASGDKRDPDGNSLFNTLLNYGYGIIRAATARALVSAGLQPAIGIHHHRRNNPFCLADDVMEPLRPLVDTRVAFLLANGGDHAEFSKAHRKTLLELLAAPVAFNEQTGPLMAVLPRYVASVFNVLTGRASKLTTPIYQ